jgi:hypothetical protein
MHYPELMSWAGEYGFTKDELAWIQPGYPPSSVFSGMDEGVDGHVNDIILGDDQVVYAAGLFDTAGGNATANIAAWISGFAGFDWFPLGNGLSAEIHSIISHEGEIYAAGQYFDFEGEDGGSAVAKWNGTTWTPVGHMNGTVQDIIFYQGFLYAAGSGLSEFADFDTNFMKWNGTNWDYTAVNIDPGGIVYTLEEINGVLYLGGEFNLTVDSIRRNIVGYNDATDVPEPIIELMPDTPMTVYDIIEHNETIYICGNLFGAIEPDSEETPMPLGLQKLAEESMEPVNWVTLTYEGAFAANADDYIKSMTIQAEQLILAGQFESQPFGVGTFGYNLCSLEEGEDYAAYVGLAVLDGPAYIANNLDGALHIGGAFETNATTTELNGIGVLAYIIPISVEESELIEITAFPNPVNDQLTVRSDVNGMSQLNIINNSGQLMYQKNNPSTTELIDCSNFAKGLYLLQLTDRHNHSYYRKLIIQ